MWFSKKQKEISIELEPSAEVIDYILKARKAGASDGLIRENLTAVGWQTSVIDGSFLSINSPLGSAPNIEVIEVPQEEVVLTKDLSHKFFIFFVIIFITFSGLAFLVIQYGIIGGKEFLGYSVSDYILAKYIDQAGNGPASGSANLTYEDGGNFEFSLGDKKVVLKNLGGMINWKGSHDFHGESKAAGTFSLTGTNNGENYEADIDYRLVDGKIYTLWKPSLSAQPFFNKYGINPDVWYELNSSKSTTINSNSKQSTNSETGSVSPKGVVTVKKLLGSEWKDNTLYLHYDMQINSERAKSALMGYVLNLPKYNFFKGKYSESASLVSSVNSIIDNLNIESLEVWVNAKNFKPSRILLKSNAPSLVSIIGQSLKLTLEENSQLQTPIGQRLKDVRDIQSALEKYKSLNGGFPVGSKNGTPENLVPEHLSVWPTEPSPSDKCSDFYNSYWYTPEGTAYLNKEKKSWVYPKYSLTFCLPEKLGKFEAGIGIATQDKLITTTVCQNGRPNCYKNEAKVTSGSESGNYFSGIPFSANLNFEQEFSSFNPPAGVEVPTDTKKLSQPTK